MSGENARVSGENLIVVVPPVRVLDRIRIHVPAISVPVRVDRVEHQRILVCEIIRATTL